jgi:hypothetical protein
MFAGYDEVMTKMAKTIEFETELTGSRTLNIPPEIAATLPSKGTATVVVFVEMDTEDTAWRRAAYEQFLSDDSEQDAVYDKYR